MAVSSDTFEQYLEHLAAGFGHADRVDAFKQYRTGLMLPLPRKCAEPLAAHIDPLHASARHQALLRHVSDSIRSLRSALSQAWSNISGSVHAAVELVYDAAVLTRWLPAF
nr:transposase [Noviherbaspirillum malthae]